MGICVYGGKPEITSSWPSYPGSAVSEAIYRGQPNGLVLMPGMRVRWNWPHENSETQHIYFAGQDVASNAVDGLAQILKEGVVLATFRLSNG